ncbi:unnamed protein product, partial [Cladocopium goreaui]
SSAAASVPTAKAELQKAPSPVAETSLLQELNKDLPKWPNASGSQQPAEPNTPALSSAAASVPTAKAKLETVPPMEETSLLEELNKDLPKWPNASGSQQPAEPNTPAQSSAAASVPTAKAELQKAPSPVAETSLLEELNKDLP